MSIKRFRDLVACFVCLQAVCSFFFYSFSLMSCGSCVGVKGLFILTQLI